MSDKMSFEVRSVRGEDLSGICRIIDAALPADPTPPELFAQRVFLDQNFDPEGVLVAETPEGVAGFVVSMVRRHRIEDMADDFDKSWVPMFAVHPAFQRRGIASALFEAVEQRVRALGKKEAQIGPYIPNWWTPGVDVAAYPGAIEFLKGRGYVEAVRPLSMDSNLVTYRRPQWIAERQESLEAAGVVFERLRPELVPGLFAFLRAEFPGDWQRHLRQTCNKILSGAASTGQINVVHENGRILGFAHSENERFGPFGTAAAERGRGLGAVLLCLQLEFMRGQGLHDAFFLWTSDSTAKLYSEAGFRETRRFALMKKSFG